eukprot:Rmarinus@m.22507
MATEEHLLSFSEDAYLLAQQQLRRKVRTLESELKEATTKCEELVKSNEDIQMKFEYLRQERQLVLETRGDSSSSDGDGDLLAASADGNDFSSHLSLKETTIFMDASAQTDVDGVFRDITKSPQSVCDVSVCSALTSLPISTNLCFDSGDSEALQSTQEINLLHDQLRRSDDAILKYKDTVQQLKEEIKRRDISKIWFQIALSIFVFLLSSGLLLYTMYFTRFHYVQHM